MFLLFIDASLKPLFLSSYIACITLQVPQDSIKEIEKLKPLPSMNNDASGEQLGRRFKHNIDGLRSPSQRWTKKILSFSSFKERKVERCCSRRTGQSCGTDNINLATEIALHASNRPSQIVFPLSGDKARDCNNDVHVVKHYFPSPVVSWVEDASFSGQVSHVVVPESNNGLEPSYGDSSTSNPNQDVHISVKLKEEFLDLAKENTNKDLETCGILGAFLKNHIFYITTLIIPKQESTSNSCQAINEEEIHAILDEMSLYPAGWIHTHPSQSCFLSSIDLHTQYSYQVMLPEAIAIVMAPTDPKSTCGIFRLTNPGGINVLKECKESGFHPHPSASDGSPIYESCSNIYENPNLRFEIIDLRSSS
ncbi:unnamed protein product [Musa banksii]